MNLHYLQCRFFNEDLPTRIVAECNRLNGFVPYEQGYVYAIHATGTNYYKLGKSKDPDRRLLQIAPQMPFTTRFVKVWKTNFMSIAESWLHTNFAKYRANGEWFEFPDEILECLLYSMDVEFSEQIRFAYGSTFLSRVTTSPEEKDSFCTWIAEETDLAVYTGLDGGCSSFTGWIEDAFNNICRQQYPAVEDLTEKFNNAQRAKLRRLRIRGLE